MSTGGSPRMVRVKLPCADEAEFLRRYAGPIGTKGLFVPSASPKPVGAQLVLRIEIDQGDGVIADAVVARHAEQGKRRGMSLTLTRLHPGSIQFELSGGAPAPAAASAGSAQGDLSGAASRAPERAALDLDPGGDGPAPEDAELRSPLPPPGSDPRPLESIFDVPDESAPREDDVREIGRARDPGERYESERASAAGPDEADSEAGPRGLPRWVIPAAVAAGIALGAVVFKLATGPDHGAADGTATSRAGAATPAAPAAATAAATADGLEARLALAEERTRAGRLVGPSRDEALDHLLAARALAPQDPRVIAQLSRLADRFEAMAEVSLTQGDRAEAAAQLQAALIAAPDRAAVAAKLREIEAAVRAAGAAPAAR